ncbi:MAG: hypothetical protein LC795_20440 [Acidobacteria bacterium]|nr:hypothetical protein [Acidobacteriota bacterium]
MKTVRYFFSALALTSALSLSTFAGDIHTGLEPQPTPTPVEAQGETSTTLNGDMHTTEAGADVTLAGAVVDLVRGVLALL